ncbi:hypothetical protein R6Q59_006971 [Mikania micrantha]
MLHPYPPFITHTYTLQCVCLVRETTSEKKQLHPSPASSYPHNNISPASILFSCSGHHSRPNSGEPPAPANSFISFANHTHPVGVCVLLGDNKKQEPMASSFRQDHDTPCASLTTHSDLLSASWLTDGCPHGGGYRWPLTRCL